MSLSRDFAAFVAGLTYDSLPQAVIDRAKGVTLQALQEAVEAHDLAYPLDLGARGTATLGGTVATNAGGIRVCKYGMTRSQVEGVEAVLADGAVVRRMSGLAKDNTGFDLTGLLTGSEGTLGVITAVRVRLHDPAEESVVASATGRPSPWARR